MTAAAYPPNLTRHVLDQWPVGVPLELSAAQLEEVLAVSYLASLTTEEGRPVRFRLLLTPPSALPEEGRPNQGALRLRFAESRPCDPDELRRLSPAVPFETALIGVCLEAGRPRIWGIAHSGAAWLAPSWGGRSAVQNWTLAPIVHVTGPGRLAVRAASQLIAGLERGVLITSAMDVFDSDWLHGLFAQEREHMRQTHASAIARQPGETNDIDESLILTVSQHMLRRALRLIRGAGHGGMILFVEADSCAALAASIRLKYTFAVEEPQRRYQTLLGTLTTALAAASQKGSIGWEDFRDAHDPVLTEVEAQIFELSRLVASLAATDGAVLMNKKLEVLGFGVEVSAELPAPTRVWRALDAEGNERVSDAAESVGTRHRAAYRFAQSHPGGLAVVVSHDGAVRFVTWRDDGVTYWEHAVSP